MIHDAGTNRWLKNFIDDGMLAIGKVRRFYFYHFRRKYVEEQLRSRRGECRQCAVCCSLLFPCAALTGENLCRRYRGRRWAVCAVFPIDHRDISDVARNGGSCGYYFPAR